MTTLCDFDHDLIAKAYAKVPQPICPDEARHAEDMLRIAQHIGPSLLEVFGEALRPEGVK